MSPAIDRLERLGFQRLTPDGLASFLTADRVLIFLTRKPQRVREANDAAVIFPELLRAVSDACGHSIVGGFLTTEQETDSVRAELGVLSYPSVVAYQNGRFVGVVPGMKAWSEYVSALSAFFQPAEAVQQQA
jgi:hydrogenase-1 operon protein HyaE